MLICGIKLTHDGAIALIDGNKMVFSYESEKLNNNKRHSVLMLGLPEINALLSQYGYSLEMIDRLVLDGWGREWDPPTVEKNEFDIHVQLNGTSRVKLSLSGYGHLLTNEDVLEANDFRLQGTGLKYRSYRHVSGHLFSAYCTSPFAEAKARSFVLVWDGVMPPQLFHHDPQYRQTRNLGPLFPVLGSIYTLFPHEYKPFSDGPLDPSIAGKAMAYAALGKPLPEVSSELSKILNGAIGETNRQPLNPLLVAIITKAFVTRAKAYSIRNNIAPADMIASLHQFMQDLLVNTIGEQVRKFDGKDANLCFAGGCALNIKWNSALRDAGIFNYVWVPPFPNDSGSAIGTACCELVKSGESEVLDWNVYSGPPIAGVQKLNGAWSTTPCTLKDLASLIHHSGEPIVFLNGRAELGPRALGNRSILAAPSHDRTKQFLNEIKIREDYRPVAPVCLEEDAPEIFSPGSLDPYMLFEHKVRDAWGAKTPAIRHLDGTARLQTVTRQQNPSLYELLTQYKQLSGIPLLCNTNANHKGKGFFPDISSVVDWDRLNYIWNDGCLYSKGFRDHG
jgi:carbamoyltransferase